MRDDSMRLFPRISTTVSFGSNTSVICSASSMSRIRAWRLSTTLFSCPEYVWIKYHCFISKTLSPRDLVNNPCNGFQNVHPRLIDQKKVNSKEDNADDDDDGRVLYILRRRKCSAVQLGTSLFDKLADAFFLFITVVHCSNRLGHVFSPKKLSGRGTRTRTRT